MISPKGLALASLVLALLVNQARAETLRLYVERGEASALSADGNGMLRLYLSAKSEGDLAGFTIRHVGKRIDVMIGGDIVLSPVIREPVSGAVVPLPTRMSAAESAQTIRKLVNGDETLEIRLSAD